MKVRLTLKWRKSLLFWFQTESYNIYISGRSMAVRA